MEARRLFLAGKFKKKIKKEKKRIVAPTKIVFGLTTFIVFVFHIFFFLGSWLAERETRTKGNGTEYKSPPVCAAVCVFATGLHKRNKTKQLSPNQGGRLAATLCGIPFEWGGGDRGRILSV